MSARTNRRDKILAVAARLFREQGYPATSVRQIAEQVGCTEAALYYHFKEGKRALLAAVAEQNMPKMEQIVEACQGAPTLYDFLKCHMRQALLAVQENLYDKLRWLTTDFPRFEDAERTMLHTKHAAFHARHIQALQRYVPDEASAAHLAWMVEFMMFGYVQVMINLDMLSAEAFDTDEFIEQTAARLAAIYERGE